MAFSAEALTAGLKPQNSVLSRERLNQSWPKAVSEEVKLDMFGYLPLRFPSLQ